MTLLDDPQDEDDDDSIFLPYADLFSLLSVTILYVVLTFGQTTPVASQPVSQVVQQGSGPGKPIDPLAAYVTLREGDGTVVFSITRGGLQVEQTVDQRAAATHIPETWLRETLSQNEEPPVIYIYLLESEQSLLVRALFTDTQRFLRANFKNVRLAV